MNRQRCPKCRRPYEKEPVAESAQLQRMTDLVCQMRVALHSMGLITDQEYADLAQRGAVARLEGYDMIRGTMVALLDAVDEYRRWFDTCSKTNAPEWQEQAVSASTILDKVQTQARLLSMRNRDRRCQICFLNGVVPAPLASRICNELNQPVCAMHALKCDQDGHGTRPLEV